MQNTEKPKRRQRLINWTWVLTIVVLSFLISVSMSYISNEALGKVGIVPAFFLLLAFIGLGILFDVVGVAATSATEKEFHSMAARRVKGAREAVWLARNAAKVSSICNDVVGDIAGIISGATGAIIITRITAGLTPLPTLIVTITVTGLIAALTIGGKAVGKSIGIRFSVRIIYAVGRMMCVLPVRLQLKR